MSLANAAGCHKTTNALQECNEVPHAPPKKRGGVLSVRLIGLKQKHSSKKDRWTAFEVNNRRKNRLQFPESSFAPLGEFEHRVNYCDLNLVLSNRNANGDAGTNGY